MGNSLSSNAQNEEQLSLEDTYKILAIDEEKKSKEEKIKINNPDNFVSNKVGVITNALKDGYIVDDQYVVQTELDLSVGARVRFDLFSSDDIFKVTNVELIDNEWDVPESSNSLWSTRVIICQVDRRIERKLYLTQCDIMLNLDDVPLEFLPMVGDWLELQVKCTVNENKLDLSGKIIEIDRISPVRLHLEIGKVTNWKSNEGEGTINNKIFFNKASLSIGHVPMLGDKVVCEVIESSQNRFLWRAIKVLPETVMSHNRSKLSSPTTDTTNYEENHPGLEINDINLSFDKLGIKQNFSINISNNADHDVLLKTVKFTDINASCKVIDNRTDVTIKPNDTLNITCECISKNIGHNKDMFTLTFDKFTLKKWVNISTLINSSNLKIPYEYKPNLKLHDESENELIRGEKSSNVRFTVAKIPNYLVPQKLADIMRTYNRKDTELFEQLKSIKPSLTANLTLINYEDKFHTLLHLDEIMNLISVQVYDQDRACFVKNGEFLMLEIDNLAEKRPSLIIGDRIIATDPMNKNKLDYEGFINKVGSKHVYLKFNRLFHDSYNGEDYSIKVVPGRASYKRLHHAVSLAVRNLGQELLFPTRITEREPQVDFTCNSDSNKLKLEWYNKRLNATQQNAVKHILWGKARPLPYIIFGPPGTGKTVTIIETILQLVRLLPSSRLLVTAPSNSAADLVALRLIDSGVLMPGDLIRIVSYNYALSDAIPAKLVPYCATASSAKEDTIQTDLFTDGGIKLDCSQSILGRHRITVATCGAAGQFFTMGLTKGHFSHIIVDEAAQAAEPEVLISMALLDKTSGQMILAGDPMQLGPVVLCKIAEECGLGESYLERLINRFPYIKDPAGFSDTCGYDPRLVTKLLYNYRALPDILNLYSNIFYSDELIPTIDEESSSEAQLLNTLAEIIPRRSDGRLSQVIFHGVNGENYQTEDSPSWFNPHEAAQVFHYINELYRLGLKSNNIGIISPYVKQVREIRSLLIEAEFDLPRIGTVEDFQGQEFDVIILSTVRSSEQYVSSDVLHCLGFVANPKRLNVAISRSKTLLIIVGNPKLLCCDIYWRSVVKYCLDKGCYVGCEF